MTKEFCVKDGILTCVIEHNNCYGSIEYSFTNGELTAHRPENFNNTDWLLCCRKFISICQKLNAPFLDRSL